MNTKLLLLNEGVETKNMDAAKTYLYKKYGYSQRQALDYIGNIKRDMPNSKLAKCRFIAGLVRMSSEYQLGDNSVVEALNDVLPYVASEPYVSQYNQDLNGLSAEEIINTFKPIMDDAIDKNKQELSKKQYNGTNGYKIVPIESYEAAAVYKDYCDWCVCVSRQKYNQYTGNGKNMFYFCLKDGWDKLPSTENMDDIEKYEGENTPLDDYGLSMIAVVVGIDGNLKYCTCRWNHENYGNDQVMDANQLSEVVGANFYDVFKPRGGKQISTEEIIKAIEEGNSRSRILKAVAVGRFNIPEGTRCIGDKAFEKCEKLVSVNIPSSVKTINRYAFYDCGQLKDVTFNEGLVSIGERAFGNCDWIEKVILPDTVTEIGAYCFANCKSLQEVKLSKSLTVIPKSCFKDCVLLLEVVIPNSVNKIESYAFHYCDQLYDVFLPNVDYIGDYAFYDCFALSKMKFGKIPSHISKNAVDQRNGTLAFVPSEEAEMQLQRVAYKMFKIRVKKQFNESKTIKISESQYKRLFEDAEVIGLDPTKRPTEDMPTKKDRVIRGQEDEEGNWVFKGRNAIDIIPCVPSYYKAKCSGLYVDGGLPIYEIPKDLTNLVWSRWKAISVEPYGGESSNRNDMKIGYRSEPSDKDKELQGRIDSIDLDKRRIAAQEDYIRKLKKMAPMEQIFYQRWQKAVGTPKEAELRDRYETYYRRHEDVILALQRAEDDLERMRKEHITVNPSTKNIHI